MLVLSKARGAFLGVLLCIWGCASSQVASSETASPPAPESTEPSVHPGINDHYFRPDGPERYTRILESETREIVQRSDDIVAAIGLKKGADVADIGAGTGLLTWKIAEAVGKRGHVYAVDIVPEFLDT
ncbi:MAG: class I SAM-dependent methyltransferase, partial [Polyangiales bacterium]